MTDPLWIDASGGAPAYASAELRRLMAVDLQYDGRVLGARQGVRPGGTGLDTTLAGSTITVKAGTAVIDPALTTTQGPYRVAIATDETHTLTAAHATLPRKDITILRVYDHAEDSSGLRLARSEYLVGTAAGSPSEPAVPAGAFRLATIDVPASGGGSPVVTINKPFTVAAGGIVPVRDATERAALTAYNGLAIYRLDRAWVEFFDGAVWRVHDIATICTSTSDRDAAITDPFDGQLAYTSDTGKVWQRRSGAWREWPSGKMAQLRQTVTQTLAHQVLTDITLSTEDWDVFTEHDTVTNNSRYTAGFAGVREFSGGVAFAASGTGARIVQWAKNGSAINASDAAIATAGAGLATRVPARTIDVDMAAGDYVTLQALQDTGGNLNTVASGAAASSMTVRYVGG